MVRPRCEGIRQAKITAAAPFHDALPCGFAEPEKGIQKTDRDITSPDDIYSQRRAHSGRIAKLDVDGDFNYDGIVDNDDPSDNGLVQQTPPGMVLGTGEMTRLVIRFSPYQINIDTKVRFELSVAGINRGDKTGRYESLEQELASAGHIRVWADPDKKKLLLDSSKADRRVWTMDLDNVNPESVIRVPHFVFVEGYKPSTRYAGDIRLLARVIDVRASEAEQKQGFAKALAGVGFRPSYDHVLFTVQSAPHAKSLVGRGDVWISK